MNAQVISPHAATNTATGQWFEPLQDWPRTLLRLLKSESAVVRVVVAEVRGSAPREAGACMLVERGRIHGTIGGGHLEWAAVQAARALLDDLAAPAARVQRFVLATELAQCCGGVVELWIERYTVAESRWLQRAVSSTQRGPRSLVSTLTQMGIRRHLNASIDTACSLTRSSDGSATLTERLDENVPTLWLYGAGHVGQALVQVLAPMPFRTVWVDSRPECLPADVGEAIKCIPASVPEDTVALAPDAAHFLIMTHSHALDYALCRAVLERDRFASVGVIGSKSKSARFRSRLARDGLSAEQIAKLICPIGIEGIHGKSPAIIAVAVAAQLLQTLESGAARSMLSSDSAAIHLSACSGSPRAECSGCSATQRVS